MRAILIPLTGDIIEVSLPEGDTACYNATKDAIGGGWLETVPFVPGVAPYFDEEGKIKGLPKNERASALLKGHIMRDDYIAGHCILTGFDASTGATVDLPEEWTIATIKGVLARQGVSA